MDVMVDAKGKACPQPVIMTKKALDSIKCGRVITLVDNEIASQNVQKLAKSMGFSHTIEEKDGIYRIIIEKTADIEQETEPEAEARVELSDSDYCILVTKKTLGTGPDELGSLLISGFFIALGQAAKLPRNIFFINEGVYLASQGSKYLDQLRDLEQKGVIISSCGTCLEYYNLKDKVAVGKVTNMYDIVDTITRTRTITL